MLQCSASFMVKFFPLCLTGQIASSWFASSNNVVYLIFQYVIYSPVIFQHSNHLPVNHRWLVMIEIKAIDIPTKMGLIRQLLNCRSKWGCYHIIMCTFWLCPSLVDYWGLIFNFWLDGLLRFCWIYRRENLIFIVFALMVNVGRSWCINKKVGFSISDEQKLPHYCW